MLIIEIALGIVLAVVVLMFLPQILSLGIWAVILAVGLAVVGGVIFLAIEHVGVALLIAIVIGGIILTSNDELKIHDKDEEKERRKKMGYDD